MTTNYGSPITGTLTATTAVVNVVGIQIPASIALNSADAGKAIAFSFDGTNYYTATPTGSMTGQIYYTLPFPVKTVKFTGAINDTYAIL
jgi:hypothetical protein